MNIRTLPDSQLQAWTPTPPQMPLLKIGELADQTGIAVGTIRYYEGLGLIAPDHRSQSGYRYYTQSAIQRLQFIKKAQLLQFSLTEIQQILSTRHRGDPACPVVKDLLDRKIVELEIQLQRMAILKLELETYRDRWVDRPFDNPQGKELCSLIEEVATH
jgi:DNA-binding transcriptional MerR regulator